MNQKETISHEAQHYDQRVSRRPSPSTVDIDKIYHTELLTKCLMSKAMILISGYENDLYDTILTNEKGWEKHAIPAITKDTSGKEHERTEILWSNKKFNKAFNNKRTPIRLAKKEKQYNKVNPTRQR